jgi:hypothetical protein
MTMLELALRVFEEIVHFWEFFIVSIIAIVGWVFSRDSAWSDLQRWAVAAAFTGCVVFNLIGLKSSYMALEVVVSELKHQPANPTITQKTTLAMIKRFSLRFWMVGLVVHIIIDAIVLYFILILSGQPLE